MHQCTARLDLGSSRGLTSGLIRDRTGLRRREGRFESCRVSPHGRRFTDWGRWGLSAFYARNEAEVEDLGADQLERFPLLGCYRVIDLQAAGFEVWPTFRTPHVTIAFTGDLDERLAALVRAAHEVRTNPYHESDDKPER